MRKSISVIIFAVLLGVAMSSTLLGNLPPKVISDVIGILTQGVKFVVGDCKGVQQTQNHFMLYTRNKPNEAILLKSSNVNEIRRNKPIVFITHGWLDNGSHDNPQNLKKAYLSRTDCNVVVVDWSVYADVIDYTTAYCNARVVGKQLGDLLCEINATQDVDLETVHLVGHSLGAHVSGFAGDHVRRTCEGVVGRITGLDPAGPGFQDVATSQRLDTSDAVFVDIIHTNQGIFGYYGKIGHVDFYVNCGTVQPGCLKVNIVALLATPLLSITCSHVRSVTYFAEGIKTDRFKAISCGNCPLLCVRHIFNPTTVIMGEECPRNPRHKSYVIATNSKAPYARG